MDGLFLFDTEDLPAAQRPTRAPRRRRKLAEAPASSSPWPLNGAINVVLFAGMGGACQGLEDAGFPVHVAVNHDRVAIAAHKALNPHTRHLHADIYEVCPVEATGGRSVNILWASPDCRDHSVAKGGAPRSPRVRSMPWQVCRWVGVLRKRGYGPEVVYLENVREIRGWGPLVAKRDKATGRVVKADGTVAAKGERVPVQQQMLVRDPKRAGQTYRAWKKHMTDLGARYEDRDLNCADFGIPTSRKRLFGVATFSDAAIRWMPETHAPRKSELALSGARQPYRMAAEIINWSLPLPSIFNRKKELAPATRKRIAVGMHRFVLQAERPFLVHLTHGARDHDTEEPFPTVTSAHRGELAVVGAYLEEHRTRSVGQQIGEPLVAQTVRDHSAVIGASLVPTTHTKSGDRIHDGATPVPTLTAGVKGGEFAVMGALMVQTGYGERDGQTPRALDIEAPIGTQVTNGGKHALVGAWMVKNSTDVVGLPASDPLSTIVTTVGPQAVGAAYLTELRGTSRDGQSATEPAGTMCTGGGRGGGHDAVTAAILSEPPALAPEKLERARRVAEFLRGYGLWDDREFVTVGPWLVVDIGMRMLTPAEAAAAHELTMPETIEIDGVRRPLTKTEAMRLVGNSVPKRMAMLLAQANAEHALYAHTRYQQAAE